MLTKVPTTRRDGDGYGDGYEASGAQAVPASHATDPVAAPADAAPTDARVDP